MITRNSNGTNSSILGQHENMHRKPINPRNGGGTGVFVGRVVDNADPDYDGNMWVEIVGGQNSSAQDDQEQRQSSFNKVRYVQSDGGTLPNDDGSNTTYGTRASPPAIGSMVILAYADGFQEGFVLGTVPTSGLNASVPGLSASESDTEEGVVTIANESRVTENPEGNTRPRSALMENIALAGLGLDAHRGVGSEGSRRESPSRVTGSRTPSGHSIVMDDGTYEYQEGSNYTPDQNRVAGSNNLIRIRSAGGSQILLNDEIGIVYIQNGSGNSWIEMDSSGNIDIYSSTNISYHAEENINFYAGDTFNIEADSVNIKARGENVNIESAGGDINMYATSNANITADANINEKASGDIRQTSGGNIHLNGPTAKTAEKAVSEPLTVNRGVNEGIGGRVPEREPYGGHVTENFTVAVAAPSGGQKSANDTTTEA